MSIRDEVIRELENEGITVTAWHPTQGIPTSKLVKILEVVQSDF